MFCIQFLRNLCTVSNCVQRVCCCSDSFYSCGRFICMFFAYSLLVGVRLAVVNSAVDWHLCIKVLSNRFLDKLFAATDCNTIGNVIAVTCLSCTITETQCFRECFYIGPAATKCTVHQMRQHRRLRDFLEYVDDVYVGRNATFQPSMWNVFAYTMDLRTNNMVERQFFMINGA